MRRPCGRWWGYWKKDAEFSGGDPGVFVHAAVRHVPPSAGFDRLSMMTEHIIRCNPFSGHLFVFCNRRSDRVKILSWDRDGWAIWYKRLEAGTFQFPFSETGRREVAAWELAVLLEGIDLKKEERRKRYRLPGSMSSGQGEERNGTRLAVADTDKL